MKIAKSVTVTSSVERTWEFLQNVPRVAECFPGGKLSAELEDGTYKGSVRVKLGPFTATFEGEASYEPDPELKSGRVEGKATDKKGGSRSRLSLNFKLSSINRDQSKIEFDADIQLAGPIAQFGRIGVIEEAAELIIADFVKNVEANLSVEGQEPNISTHEVQTQALTSDPVNQSGGSNGGLSLLRVIWAVFKGYFSKHKTK